MCIETLREMEIQCRGASGLIEAWKGNHFQVREIWKLEDVIKVFAKCHEPLKQAYSEYTSTEKTSSRAAKSASKKFDFPYFLNVLQVYKYGAEMIAEIAGVQESTGYEIEGLSELRASIQYTRQILESHQNCDLQKALDLIDSSMDVRMMTPEEASCIRQALQHPVSSIQVEELPLRNPCSS